jgi:class 3 adenylate cyclase
LAIGPPGGVAREKEADVFGDAPNIAARVQEAAAPGTVLVTEDTPVDLGAVRGRGARDAGAEGD